jgi:hypothetical protein
VSCNGGSNASASVLVSGGAGVFTYSWSPTGGTAATASGLVSGSYSCTITDANSCSIIKNFTITEPAVIDTSVTVASGVVTATQTGATYQWIKCPSTLLTGETNQTFEPKTIGDYKVEITVGACLQTSNCVTVSTLGTPVLTSKAAILVYPNPFNDVFYIESSDNGTATVVDILGRVILNFKIISGTNNVNLSNAPSGTYLLKITNYNNESKTVKLLKK